MSMYARRKTRSTASRERIIGAVRELLEAGAFHATTVEEVADRAGVSRATLYQHFGGREGLVDAACDLMAATPELAAIRETTTVADFVARTVDLWAAEEPLLAQLYGAAAVDPAAAAFVQRQRRDRYAEIRRVLALERRDDDASFAALAALTSFDTYLELRRGARRSKADVVRALQRLTGVRHQAVSDTS
jgi:AcrR family transcriptional regulator